MYVEEIIHIYLLVMAIKVWVGGKKNVDKNMSSSLGASRNEIASFQS